MASTPGHRRRSFFTAIIPVIKVGSGKGSGAVRVDFPYRVSVLDKLPEPFAAAVPPALETIFIPPQGFVTWQDRRWWGQRRAAEPSRVLALGPEQLWVLEGQREGMILHEAAFDELLEIEIGNVLLHAWVAFVADGTEPIRLDFNLVALPIFENLLDRVLDKLRDDNLEVSSGGSAGLAGLDLKFRNAVRGRLLPGETLRAVTFAPAVWERRFLVLRRRLVAATALAATDWRLLIVEEGEPVRENTYGSSAYSIPRSRIEDLRRTADGVVISFHTRGDKRERKIPLSNPDVATPIIDAIAEEVRP